MAAYAVYDVETGEVVHLHVEPDELGSAPEEILLMADVSRSRRLEVIRLPRQELPSRPARVVDGELSPEGATGWGQAGVGGDAVDDGPQRRYAARPRPGTSG